MSVRVDMPDLRIERTEVGGEKGYAVYVEGKIERFETSAYAAEQFVRGIQWAGREFGWASERLAEFGNLADSLLTNTPHRNVAKS